MKKSLRFRYLVIFTTTIFTMGFGPATPAKDNAPFPRILVSGQGSVDLAPDMAILSLTVTREADTAHSALDANLVADNITDS